MLKRVIGTKGVSLLAGLVMVMSLSGCANGPTEQDSTGTVIYEEEQSGNRETENSEQTITDNTSDHTETAVTLTDKGKDFLNQMCRELNDFHSGQTMDEKFWQDFLFHSYTGVSSESAVTEQVYREDLGFEETVVKVSLQEAPEHVKLVFGVELPDYQYTFSECVADQENDANTIVKYTIDFMGESNIGTVTFCISPQNNENGSPYAGILEHKAKRMQTGLQKQVDLPIYFMKQYILQAD